MNLVAMLEHAAARYPDQLAVVCGDKNFSYAEFAERVRRMAMEFAEQGVGRDTPVAFLHRNCHRYLEAYFAAAALGALIVPLNVRLAANEIAAILADSEAGLLVAEDGLLELATQAVAELSAQKRPILMGAAGTADSLEEGLADPPVADLDTAQAAEDDAAQLYYTSGTTGRAKGVVLTHGNVSAHARAAIAELGLDRRDVWLHAAPLFHLADAWATWAITWVGGTHVLLPEFTPAQALATIAATGVTITNLVPTMLVKLVNHPGVDARSLRSMRRILSGGSPMAPELLTRIEALFPCEYVQTYGLTETSPYLTLSLLGDDSRKLPPAVQQELRSTTGRPMQGVEVRVVDIQGQPVPADGVTVGEIVARGPTVTPGYFKRPEETERAFRDGWFHTGDLAHVRPDGYLNIVDRLKDVINTGGETVYSTEIENALYAHPAVGEAAVIAIPDPQWGEAVHAVVVLREPGSCDADELIAHCRGRLAAFKVPRSVALRTEIPKTGSGKIDKKDLREPYWAGEDRQVR